MFDQHDVFLSMSFSLLFLSLLRGLLSDLFLSLLSSKSRFSSTLSALRNTISIATPVFRFFLNPPAQLQSPPLTNVLSLFSISFSSLSNPSPPFQTLPLLTKYGPLVSLHPRRW